MIFRRKETVLDAEFPNGNLKHLEVCYLLDHWRRLVILLSATVDMILFTAHVLASVLVWTRSSAGGLEPVLRLLGLHRIEVEWVLGPEILLTEPNDVILFEPPIPVECLIFWDDILVRGGGYRSDHTTDVHLGTRIEHVRCVFNTHAVANLEATWPTRRAWTFFTGSGLLHGDL
jgi:hypothetical protein